MNLQLVAINAKYIHTNLALRYLKQCAIGEGFPCELAEYSINQRIDDILGDLYVRRPDIIAFSCYLWNISYVRELGRELKKVLPQVQIWLGGPEVSFHCETFLAQNSWCDIIIRGEGEETFPQLLNAAISGEPLDTIFGLAFRKRGQVVQTPVSLGPALSLLPFPYEDLTALENKILYFETSRGCPFSCSYCLSSSGSGVRLMPEEQACSYLQNFLDAGVPQVKFVDRTFNCNPNHANAILAYLIRHDNGITNFHFEISADILQDSTVELLQSARPGLFQLEIGVQSTNPQTLEAIHRRCDQEKLFRKVRKLRRQHNAHIHLDLIAGLPFENYSSFANSYDQVFSLHPDMLQLGFLKVLKGSQMEADCQKFGIVYQSRPPYEVLKTKWLSYGEILRLKQIDLLNDAYLNSGRFLNSLSFILERWTSPFQFFEELCDYFSDLHLWDRTLSKLDYYLFLYEFYVQRFGANERLRWLIKHDILSRERAKGLPQILNPSLMEQNSELCRNFFTNSEALLPYFPDLDWESPRQAAKTLRLELYPFSMLDKTEGLTAVVYDYRKKDVDGNVVWKEFPCLPPVL